MRRKDRAIQTEEELLTLLDGCETLRLGLNSGGYPYVVPLSFGWEVVDERLYIYVHGAQEGLRHEWMATDFRVCVEADRFLGYERLPGPGGITTRYESVIGFGRAANVTGAEAVHGLRLILDHCGYPEEPVEEQVLRHTSVWKITMSQLTGKRNVK